MPQQATQAQVLWVPGCSPPLCWAIRVMLGATQTCPEQKLLGLIHVNPAASLDIRVSCLSSIGVCEGTFRSEIAMLVLFTKRASGQRFGHSQQAWLLPSPFNAFQNRLSCTAARQAAPYAAVDALQIGSLHQASALTLLVATPSGTTGLPSPRLLTRAPCDRSDTVSRACWWSTVVAGMSQIVATSPGRSRIHPTRTPS